MAERTIGEAVESCLGDCRARKLADSTITSYAKTLEHLQTFCEDGGPRFIEELDLGVLRVRDAQVKSHRFPLLCA
jgi:hypothetical protein